jgi:hypothetical protein
MSLRLNAPYKIIHHKQKRYESHYLIPAATTLVVPLKELGEEVSCDVRWEDTNGELKVLHNKLFIVDNLVPLNAMVDVKLHEIWEHYYDKQKTDS